MARNIPSSLTPAPTRTRRAAPAGVSLLEVLISIFVITVGLLGVIAVIPVGRLQIGETAIADRSAACGRAGLHEVVVRRMLDPWQWTLRNSTRYAQEDLPAHPGRYGVPYGRSVAIDPLFLAANAGVADPEVDWFPYNTLAAINVRPVHPRMYRVSLNEVADRTAPPQRMSRALADRLFTWGDDILFPVPEEDGQRPRQVMLAWDTNNSNLLGAAWPPRSADFAGNPVPSLTPLSAQLAGEYSWLVTVTPLAVNADFSLTPPYDSKDTPFQNIDRNRLFSVSVVVFHKRDLNYPPSNTATPGERWCRIFFPGGGLGGGEARLVFGGAFASHLDVRENEWLLVSFAERVTVLGRPFFRHIFKWYRIVNVAERDPTALNTRYVTLAGPDWTYDANNDGEPDGGAFLFNGIVGVYTTTIELDVASPWTH